MASHRNAILIDPNDPKEKARFAEQSRLFKGGLAILFGLLAPSFLFLFLDWPITAGIAANVAILVFVWIATRGT